jgi:hypothetical protein
VVGRFRYVVGFVNKLLTGKLRSFYPCLRRTWNVLTDGKSSV